MVELFSLQCRGLTISFCSAVLLVLVLTGCSNGAALTAADYATCQRLGFPPGGRDYNLCLRQLVMQRTSLAAVPEQLEDK
jgi:hypothetical protein